MENRFVIDLTGLDLSDAERKEINGQIQKVALDVLVRKNMPSPVAVHFPVEWLGIVVNPDFKTATDLDLKIGEKLKGEF